MGRRSWAGGEVREGVDVRLLLVGVRGGRQDGESVDEVHKNEAKDQGESDPGMRGLGGFFLRGFGVVVRRWGVRVELGGVFFMDVNCAGNFWDSLIRIHACRGCRHRRAVKGAVGFEVCRLVFSSEESAGSWFIVPLSIGDLWCWCLPSYVHGLW